MTERIRQDLLHGDWLRRLPHYLFVVDLIAGKRVLELGCGDGHSAHYLANHGAARVIGVDESAAAIERARSAYRVSNLDFLHNPADAIQLDDNSVDTIFLWTMGRELRRATVLHELRRLLAPGGTLICSVASADRPAAAAGVSYFELVERLSPLFSPVRLAAQTPFIGVSMVEFDGPPEPDVELDTSLLDIAGAGDEEVTHYLAICGGAAQADALRGFAIVQLPSLIGHDIVGAQMGADHAQTQRIAQPAASEADELRAQLSGAVQARERALEQLAGAQVELNKAQLELGRVTGDAALELDRARNEAAALRDRIGMLEAELEASAAGEVAPDEAEPEESTTADEWPPRPVMPESAGEYVTQPTLPGVNQQVIAAMAVHAEKVRDLELALDERQAYIDELRDQLGRKRESVTELRDRLTAANARVDGLRTELSEWRTRASIASGEVLRLRAQGGAAPAAPPVSAPAPVDTRAHAEAIAELTRERDEALDKLSRATENWKAAEARSDDIWRKVGELQSQLDAQREAAQEAAKKARSQSQVALARAMEDASKKLIGVQDQLIKAERQRDQLDAQVAELQAQLAGSSDTAGDVVAMSEVTSLRVAVAQLEDELASSRTLLRALESRVNTLVDARPAGLPSSDLALQLGIRDAELTLMNVGIASLQQRLADMVTHVDRARKDMAGQEPAEMLAIVERLAEALGAYIQ